MAADRDFIPLSIAVLTVSDTRDETTDKSGALLAQRLTDCGHRLAEKRIVPERLDPVGAGAHPDDVNAAYPIERHVCEVGKPVVGGNGMSSQGDGQWAGHGANALPDGGVRCTDHQTVHQGTCHPGHHHCGNVAVVEGGTEFESAVQPFDPLGDPVRQ